MEPTGVNMWGQLALYGAGAIALLVFSLKTMLSTMTSTYQKVIEAQGTALASVQVTNAGQQAQLNDLRDIVRLKDKECEERIRMMAAEHTEMKRATAETAEAVRKLENGK